VAKMGCTNGKWEMEGRLNFGRIIGFGTCSLVIQYWEVYFLVNEQNYTIVDPWYGEHCKVTFRRCFDHRLMLQWYKIIHIAQTLQPVEENDALIWMWEPIGIFSVRSMYVVINFRGILPVNIHAC
jgi:hypothetical protein